MNDSMISSWLHGIADKYADLGTWTVYKYASECVCIASDNSKFAIKLGINESSIFSVTIDPTETYSTRSESIIARFFKDSYLTTLIPSKITERLDQIRSLLKYSHIDLVKLYMQKMFNDHHENGVFEKINNDPFDYANNGFTGHGFWFSDLVKEYARQVISC